MMSKPQRWLARGAAAVLAALVLWLVVIHVTPWSFRTPNMTELSSRVQPLFEQTKTVCFGRFIMDVPATATVVYGPSSSPTDTYRYPGDADQLEKYVAQRLTQTEEERQYFYLTEKEPLYGKVLNGSTSNHKLVFGHSQGIFYKIYSYFTLGNDLFMQTTDAPPDDDKTATSGGWTLTREITMLNDTARHIRPRAEDEIPTEPGVCIEGAFIADNPSLTHERVAIGVRLAEFPDIHFSVQVNKNQGRLVESNALEPRMKRAEEMSWKANPVWAAQIRQLRVGPREVNQWKGFEHLTHLPASEKQADKYHFAFTSLGHPTDPLQPVLDVELKSGVRDNRSGQAKPSLSEEEAVAVWDRLIGSIRVRPTGAAARTSSAPPPAPLGMRAVTGRVCPQTGWWECADDLDLAQERRIHLQAGERMPKALVWVPPGLWQRLKGERPRAQYAAMWRLAAYGEAPPAPAAAPTPTPPDAPATPAADGAADPPPQA